jgi:maleate cis-trans isomerase
MTRHFGVLIPSTNRTVEIECRLVPATYQAHVGRLKSSGGSAGAGVPALTSAQAIGRAVRALGARRIAVVSPYSGEVNARAARYFKDKHGLETVALEGFGATDAYAIGQLGPQHAREAFARIDRPEIEVFVVPGGNFPTMSSIASWEREFGKPVVTTNQASLWAMLRAFDGADRLPAFGRLLAELPPSASR